MKIGIISPATRTGEHRYGEYLIEGLKESGFNVEILNNSLLTSRPNIKIFIGSLLLSKFLKHKNLSIIHNLDNLGPFLIKQNLGHTKTIITIHDIAPVILPEIYNVIMRFNFGSILPKLIENTDSVITISNSTKNDLISRFGVDENKINIIPQGVDDSIFYPRSSSEDVLKKYKINPNYLMYAGGDDPRKNLKSLIGAFDEIVQDIPHDLVLVGPINKKNLTNIVKNQHNSNILRDRIILPGYVNDKDLPVLYSSASAFVFPSLYEGFGLPPLEAMACGVPVIVSDNSSLKEVVDNAGVLIDDPLNTGEIAGKILDVINERKLPEKFKKRGLKQAKNYSWNNTIRQTVELYNKLI